MDIDETHMEMCFRLYVKRHKLKGLIKEKEMFKSAYKSGMHHLYHTLGMKLDLMFNEEYFKANDIIRNTWRMIE